MIPASLESTFTLDGPGEYEVRSVLLTGVRTYRDDVKGALRGTGTAFVVELDGLHTVHLGDVGHLLTQEELGDIGTVDIACVPVGGALSATKTAELIAQLDCGIASRFGRLAACLFDFTDCRGRVHKHRPLDRLARDPRHLFGGFFDYIV